MFKNCQKEIKPAKPMPPRWPPEHDKILRENWGLISAQLISQLLLKSGGCFSRLAVIGRAHRLGLAGGNTVKKKPKKEKPARQRVLAKAKIPIVSLEPMMMTMDQLQANSCRWPYGDPFKKEEFGFCGHNVDQSGKPYCKYHMALRSQSTRYPLRHSIEMDVGYVS